MRTLQHMLHIFMYIYVHICLYCIYPNFVVQCTTLGVWCHCQCQRLPLPASQYKIKCVFNLQMRVKQKKSRTYKKLGMFLVFIVAAMVWKLFASGKSYASSGERGGKHCTVTTCLSLTTTHTTSTHRQTAADTTNVASFLPSAQSKH